MPPGNETPDDQQHLLADTRPPIPVQPGQPRRQDYEYRRGGTRNIFLTCEPLAGWRHVAITERRTMQDFAHQMRWLVDEAYPDAPVIRVVLDNLNTHRMASLYETFPAAEARRIVKRLEFHHTPKHASWLNMAEIEFSALSRACLKGRNPDADALQRQITAYETERNAAGVTICPASTIFAGWRQSVLPVHLLGLAPLLGSVGPVAGDVKLQDDGVVHDPVNRRGGGHGVGKDALPLREDQV